MPKLLDIERFLCYYENPPRKTCRQPLKNFKIFQKSFKKGVDKAFAMWYNHKVGKKQC